MSTDDKNSKNNINKKAKRKSRKLAVTITLLLAVLLTGVLVFKFFIKPPPIPSAGLHNPTVQNSGKNAEANTQTPTPEKSGTSDTSSIFGKGGEYHTFVVVGRDKYGSNTDTIMIVRFDTKNHKINVVSVPRDTLVNIPETNKRVNALYAYGKLADGNGPKRLMQGLRDILGFEIGNYVVVDLAAFEQIVDAVGGIKYNVPVDMHYSDPEQGLEINLNRGEQLLNGKNALGVVRFRAGYANADIGRIATQQDFLKTAAKQMLSLGNVPNLPKIINILIKNVETNLTGSNIAFFAKELLKCKADDINFYTLPFDLNPEGIYVLIRISDWLDIVNAHLNPLSDKVTEANVDIITKVNGQFYSTTGKYAGS